MTAFTNAPSTATLYALAAALRAAAERRAAELAVQAAQQLATERLTVAYGAPVDEIVSLELVDGGGLVTSIGQG